MARWGHEDHQRYWLLYFSLKFLGAKHVTEPSDMSEMCVRIHFEHFDAERKAIPRKEFISVRNVVLCIGNGLTQVFGSLEI